ncbi:Smc ABC ATpase [Cryptosporidium ryanae]|uniref:Smc ABC ATpase n=1 Tax=Cryptosporidium ryanae TaxID=515981 RepID=UPI00351A9BF6|nr:Smc ABC ATpase [Cryptosporidium ryanae]
MKSAKNKDVLLGEVFEDTNPKWRTGQIKRVVLQDIGGHEFLDISMSSGVNLITGGNGSGKSSLVSGIALLCGWNGRKAGKDSNLAKYIRIGASKGIIRVYFSNSGTEFQVGYLPDLFGDEVIVERVIYLKGNSTYTFRGSKIGSPNYKSQEAKKHLIHFREFSNIIINNPITLLTQNDSKYLIREQSSSKSLYEFFQRAHLFDLSWKHLSEEQFYLEKAELISQNLKSKVKEFEREISDLKKVLDISNEYEILVFHENNLNSIYTLASMEKLLRSISDLESLKSELYSQKSKVNPEKLQSELSNIEYEHAKIKSELDVIKKDQECISVKLENLLREFSRISDKIVVYTSRSDELKDQIQRAREIISDKKKSIESTLNEHHPEDLVNEFFISKASLEKKLDLKTKEKKNLLADISQIKLNIFSRTELLGESEKEYDEIVNEKEENNIRINELIVEIDKNSLSLDKISDQLRSLNHTIQSNDNKNTYSISIDSKLNKFSGDNTLLSSYYNTVYDNYSELDFVEIFGYSKEVHNSVILECENINKSALIAGPIALHLFAGTNLSGSDSLIYKLDEIVGGKLERQDFGSKYLIRKNYKYWIVGSSKDKNLLLESFRKNGVLMDPTIIFIRSQFQQKRYDLSIIRKKYPKVGLAAIDLLEINNDEVFNFLVDITQIEATFIFYNDLEMELIYDYNLYIKRAYSLGSNSYRYRRGGIVVAPEIYDFKYKSHFTILKVSELGKDHAINNSCGFKNNSKNINTITLKKQEYLGQISIYKNILTINNQEIQSLKIRNSDINTRTTFLESYIKDIRSELHSLNIELYNLEMNLNSISMEEHSISMEIDQIKIETEKFNREKFHDENKTLLEIKNIENQIEQWSNSIIEYNEKIINETKIKIDKDNEIRETRALIESGNNRLSEFNNKIKSLINRKSSLICEIPSIKEKELNIENEINTVDSQINEIKSELETIKSKNDANSLNENNKLDLMSTLKYFNWIGEAKISDCKYPDVKLINSWRDKLGMQKNLLHINYSKCANTFVDKLPIDVNCLCSLKKEITMKYEKKKMELKDNKRELDDEVKLLETNKKILDKRIEQLKQSHIQSGKVINANFKHYFSLFWSNTMKPHLKFDHDKSTLNICVIPDTAITRKETGTGNAEIVAKELNKDAYTQIMNREVQSLSGGESSSIGISLLLSLSQSNSSPFHLFDEPDVYMDDVRRMIMIQSFIEFQKICSIEKSGNERQVIFVTPHNEIVQFIKENYPEDIRIIQFIKN